MYNRVAMAKSVSEPKANIPILIAIAWHDMLCVDKREEEDAFTSCRYSGTTQNK